MEVEAVVRRIEDRHVLVELTENVGSCGRCEAPGGCRSARLSELFGPSCRSFRLPNTINARPGERVIVRIGEGVMLRTALMVYLLPVLLLLLGAAFGIGLGGASDADGAALIGGAAGAVAALPVIAGYLRRRGRGGELQPSLARTRSAL